jgi:SAM-dependent methyltransferase
MSAADPQPDAVLAKRRSEDFSAELAKTGWYHSIELPGGRVTPGYITAPELRERWAEFPLPQDLSGKRVLDIGTWDGWFAFEAERRGADVVAVDNVEQENFRHAGRERGSRARYHVAGVYELPELGLGRFDYVLFLGVLYHLRHPLRALEIVCALTRDIAIVDSFIVDDDARGVIASPIPWMEFYETDELSNQIDNWCGPTLQCLLALCRSAGFARVELLSIRHRHARLACYRRWEPPPASPRASPPVLHAAVNGRYGDNGINFSTRKEEFLTCWFAAQEPGLLRQDLRLEVSGCGVPALSLRADERHRWHAGFLLPPGLDPGWHHVRLRTVNSAFSNPCPIAVDVPARAGDVRLLSLCDGVHWTAGRVASGYLALWVAGLGENADRNNVRVYCDAHRLPVEYVSTDDSGKRQVNARIPTRAGQGRRQIAVEFGGVRSAPVAVEIVTE